jgi:hypothetical protein
MTKVYVVRREERDYSDGWITTVEKVFGQEKDAIEYCRVQETERYLIYDYDEREVE